MSSISKNPCQAWWFMCVIPAMWEVEIGGLRFKTNPGKSQQVPISKTNWRDWRYASSNRTLLCKFKALSSHLSPTQKKKKTGMVVHACKPSYLGG
jgi:hypothetical protein